MQLCFKCYFYPEYNKCDISGSGTYTPYTALLIYSFIKLVIQHPPSFE